MRPSIVSVLLAGVALITISASVSAQVRHRARPYAYTSSSDIGSAPLTVNRRSWLDPGPVVPRGTGQAYISASTDFNKTPDKYFAPDGFGNDVIRGAPYVPGRPVPVVEFTTLPNGDSYVDNTLGYQNYYFNPAPDLPAPDYRQTTPTP